MFGKPSKLESWVSPKAEKGMASKIHGRGLVAILPIKKGEIVAVKTGHTVTKSDIAKLKHKNDTPALQISDELYVGPLNDNELESSLIYFNHSCDPNIGMGGNVMLIAMRDIAAGEELTADYAMFISDPEYFLQCNCTALAHRSIVSGNDWQIPALQEKYVGFFSWYIEQKIKNQKAST